MLARHPTSVGAARRFVRDVLMSRQVPGTVVDTVELLTSDSPLHLHYRVSMRLRSDRRRLLILHGHSGPHLAVTVDECVVRVAVLDRSPSLPARRLGHLDDVSGRGVIIVETMASAWGVERERNGSKRVWFEVAC